ncbi:hypothetical protein AB9L15_08240 [Lysinibacillus fusiformis]|uniref:hypothetical protein n=1 Tax=Lysinibacillus fusiformis TaxID=28031 RepID=UPI0000F36256|nr:hypothetical protein [Lysinibacillus fusiformis]EAZ85664.1 hypothetical protein BB14905_13390 [Bacillus sp. B14905]PCD82716.1 hypothetical protein CNQ87_19325 [Lysinibacillus fusiformis]
MMRESINHFMNDPWWLISKGMSESLNEELKKELSQQHILYGKEAIAVARREDNDDVIFWIEKMNKYAVVHLTYSIETSSEYPITSLYTRRELEEYCKSVSKLY